MSTLVHANKTDEVSREGGGSHPFDPTVLRVMKGSQSVRDPRVIQIQKRKPVVVLKNLCTPLSRAVEFVSVFEKTRVRIP